MDYPGGFNVITRVPRRGRWGHCQRKRCDNRSRGWNDIILLLEEGPQAKMREPLETRKEEETFTSSAGRRNAACQHLILVPFHSVKTSDFQSIR